MSASSVPISTGRCHREPGPGTHGQRARFRLAAGLLVLTFAFFLTGKAVALGAECHPCFACSTVTIGAGQSAYWEQYGSFASYSGQIEWGDGESESLTGTGTWTHSYETPSEYTVQITGSGSIEGEPPEPCTDNLSFAVVVQPLARLGILTGIEPRPASGTELIHVPIYLHPGSSSKPVLVSWRTANGTATENEDFVPASGTVELSPGTVSTEVLIEVKAAPASQPQETFNVQLTEAVNATVDPLYANTGITLAASGAQSPTTSSPTVGPPPALPKQPGNHPKKLQCGKGKVRVLKHGHALCVKRHHHHSHHKGR